MACQVAAQVAVQVAVQVVVLVELVVVGACFFYGAVPSQGPSSAHQEVVKELQKPRK